MLPEQKVVVKQIHWILFITLLLTWVGTSVLPGTVSGADHKEARQLKAPQLDVPQPQPFCGYCHILTYPSIVQKGFELWKVGKHSKVGCVECHYPPPEKKEGQGQAGDPGVDILESHIPKKPPESFSFIELDGETIKTKPRIPDASCMTANCHGNPDDTFKTKKINFTEKVIFTHQPHLDEKNQLEGQKLNCTSCHQHETEKKKFEVSKNSCFLCHFTNAKFNEGRARCDLCHKLPEKPIQTSGEKPITHEMLKEAKVTCGSCHYEVIQAAGGGEYKAYFENGELKTAVVLGAGKIKRENCLACHDKAKDIKEATNAKLMHQKHVTTKNARCMECHQPVVHAKADFKQPQTERKAKADPTQPIVDQTVRNGCAVCHPDPHRYQVLLAAGLRRKGVIDSPDPMHKARTNCFGCHTEKHITEKGEHVIKASGKTCVRCHTKDHDKMLEDWKKELAEEIEATREVEEEAMEALAASKSKLSEDQLAEAMTMLEEGRENLNIVRFGNGVHNKKYSIMLIDAAITKFDEVIEYIEESQEN